MTTPSIGGVTGQLAGLAPPFAPQPGFAAALRQASGTAPAGSDAPPAAVPFDGAGRPAWTTLSGVPVPAWQPDGPPVADGDVSGRVSGAGAPASASGASGGDLAARLPAAGQRWAGAITAAARKHRVEPELLAALVHAESNFRQDVRSRAGAIGLTQLMPGTARALRVDPYDPVANLEGGAKYLREQLDRFGRNDLALAAYNAGPNRVAAAGGIPDIAETRAYVPKVLGHYRTYKGTA